MNDTLQNGTRPRREEQLHIRLSVAQKRVLTEGARRAGLDVSSWLRSLGMQQAATWGITEETVKAPDAVDPAPAVAQAKPVHAKATPTPARKGKGSAQPRR